MGETNPDCDSDEWSEWLLRHRHGGDVVREEAVRADVDGYVDRVLDAARLGPGMTLVDIGTGDGAVAFRAIQRAGPSLRVALTDISSPLLRHAESIALQRSVADQCTFLRAPADDLRRISDACADVVTTRAVLAYVRDKGAALREFHRVLRPGGRVSIAEPILQDDAFDVIALKRMADEMSATAGHEVLSMLHRFKAAQFPDTPEKLAESSITNFSERDLLVLFQGCGFVDIHLELHIDVRRVGVVSWETFLRSSPHPWAAPHGVILEEGFTPAERATLEQVLRPVVETGASVATDRIAYVSATNPFARA